MELLTTVYAPKFIIGRATTPCSSRQPAAAWRVAHVAGSPPLTTSSPRAVEHRYDLRCSRDDDSQPQLAIYDDTCCRGHWRSTDAVSSGEHSLDRDPQSDE